MCIRDRQYLILMAVCTDYSLGITDSIQQCLNDIGIDSTPRDTGIASSFYACLLYTSPANAIVGGCPAKVIRYKAGWI